MNPRVVVAMSGGVDSSVAAALLSQGGYEVIGVTMRHLDAEELSRDTKVKDPGLASRDAAAVCHQLGIKHQVLDLRQPFSQTVIEYFVSSYLSGRTPNPCVLCNAEIKWGALWRASQSWKADYFATGHYSRIALDPESGRYWLMQAKDKSKDQSYALWRLSQEQLRHTLFPLGDMSKGQVRALAQRMGLPVAQKSESQEVCFILDDDFRRFLIDRLKRQGREIPSGEFVDGAGKVVGYHQGYPFYTIGQRKGLGVALGRPMFVTEIDVQNNRLRLGDKTDLLAGGLTANQVNWIAWEKPMIGAWMEARIRYRDPGFSAMIEQVEEDRVLVRFAEPRPAVTPGQSVVFYQGEVLAGGGIITAALPVSASGEGVSRSL